MTWQYDLATEPSGRLARRRRRFWRCLQCKNCNAVMLEDCKCCKVCNALRHALRVASMADLGFDVWQEDYGASRFDCMRRFNHELSRVMGMRRWLTVMNATYKYLSFHTNCAPSQDLRFDVFWLRAPAQASFSLRMCFATVPYGDRGEECSAHKESFLAFVNATMKV